MPALTRYAVYARVSTDEQADADLSLPRQRRVCQDWVSERGGVVVAYYADDGYSSTIMARPQLEALLLAAERRELDAVIVYNSDRMARGEDLPSVLRYLFGRHGVTIHSATESHYAGDDTSSAILRMATTLAGTVQIAKLRADVRAGLDQAYAQGRGHGIAPYGYVNLPRLMSGKASRSQGWAIEPTQAEVVRRVYAWYVDGLNCDQIAKRLNEMGVVSARPARNGGTLSKWERGTIADMLKQAAYAGYVVHNGQRGEGAHEAIIDREQWHQVQTLRDQRGQGAQSRDGSTFSGGLLVCPHCGRRMVRMSSYRRRGGAVGPEYLPNGAKNPDYWKIYYSCQSRTLALRRRSLGWSAEAIQECPGLNIAEHVILDLFVRELRALMRRARGRPVVVAPEAPVPTPVTDISREADQLATMRQRVIWQHTSGLITDAELQQQIAQIETRRKQLVALAPPPTPTVTRDRQVLTDLIAAIRSPDIPPKRKREALKAGIDRIIPSADKKSLAIVWRA